MSNKINPTSVHLGGDSNQFFAEYLPASAQDLPPSCALPPALQLDLSAKPLLPLNEACVFQFPDVIPIPPVYNPPNVKFTACETLFVKSNVTTCPATKGSKLTLQSVGPVAGTDGGPGACSISLDGVICVDACETFKGSVNVTYNHAARNSNLAVVSKSSPDCGLDIVGNIHVDACEDFSLTNSIKFDKAARGSFLEAKSTSAPHCGIDLSGVISVTACETFSADVDISIAGDKIVKKNNWSVVKTDAPDCGFKLTGDVELSACADFSSDGTIVFKGPHWKSDSSISLTARSQPDCGISLSGVLDLKACSEFTATSSVTFSGKAGVSGKLLVKPTSEPNCGLDLSGDIVIDACQEMGMTVGSTSGGIISVYTSEGGLVGQMDLSPSLSISNGIDDCNKVISLSLANASFTLPKQQTTSGSGGGGGGGCCTCYNCTGANGCQNYLNLNFIQVNEIYRAPSPCCESDKDCYIDLCQGNMKMPGNVEFGGGAISFDTAGLSAGTQTTVQDCLIQVGDSYVACDYISVGNVKLTSDTLDVGATSLTDGKLDMGSTQVEDGNISISQTLNITADEITVGATSIRDGSVSVGLYGGTETKLEADKLTLGNVTISDGQISIGDITITNNHGAVEFRQISFCVDGETKTAWVLMSNPQ